MRALALTCSILLTLVAHPAAASDGVSEINHASVSGPLGTLHEISAPGSYRLTGDLVATSNGILISANDVTLDLGGFSIAGSGTGDGISIEANNVEVRNGTVRAFGRGVVSLGNGARMLHLRVLGNASFGIDTSGLTTTALVRGCTVTDNGIGVRILGEGGLVLENVIVGNDGAGLSLRATVGFGRNVPTDNNEGVDQVSSGTAISCNLVQQTLTCPP